MVNVELPGHVVIQRRDGRREVLLHRSMAIIGPEKIEIKSARGTVILPLIGLLIAAGTIAALATRGFSLPLWALSIILVVLLFLFPVCVMALIGAVVGSDVIIDAKKGSATWQQGYLGLGIGTKELVPFGKIAHLKVMIEGDQPDRWHEQTDDLRQFSLIMVKQSGKELILSNVPVPAYGQEDGMDRTLAVANAVAALVGTTVRLPEGWELVEIDTDTGEPVEKKKRHGRARGDRPE